MSRNAKKAIVGALGGLSNVQVLGVNNFRCYGLEDQSGYNSKVLKREKLIEWLYNNMKASYDRNMTLLEGFRKHLIAEEPRCEELYEFLEGSPVEFFKLLQKVALRRTFKGKCQICEGLH